MLVLVEDVKEGCNMTLTKKVEVLKMCVIVWHI